MESLQSGDEKADEKKEHIAQYRRWNCILYAASNIIKVRQNLVAKPDESDILNA